MAWLLLPASPTLLDKRSLSIFVLSWAKCIRVVLPALLMSGHCVFLRRFWPGLFGIPL